MMRYSVMVTTVKLSKWWIQLNQEELNQASIKEYRIIWDIYTPYVGAAEKLLHINGDIINMLAILIDNIFAMLGERVFQQTVGIPMETNCAPLLADLFLY
jgi:hypothetical protein